MNFFQNMNFKKVNPIAAGFGKERREKINNQINNKETKLECNKLTKQLHYNHNTSINTNNHNETFKRLINRENYQNEILRYKKFITRNKIINGVEKGDLIEKSNISLNKTNLKNRIVKNNNTLKNKINKSDNDISILSESRKNSNNSISTNKRGGLNNILFSGLDKILKDRMITDYNNKENRNEHKVKNFLNLEIKENKFLNNFQNKLPIFHNNFIKRPISAGKIKIKPLERNKSSHNIEGNLQKLTFNNSFITQKRKNTHNLNENINNSLNFNIFNNSLGISKDNSLNSSDTSFINHTDIFEKTANFSFLQETKEKDSSPSKDNDIFDKLNKITIKDAYDIGTPQDTQVESNPLSDKNVKVKSKDGFTFRESNDSGEKNINNLHDEVEVEKPTNNQLNNKFNNFYKIKPLLKNLNLNNKNVLKVQKTPPGVRVKISNTPKFFHAFKEKEKMNSKDSKKEDADYNFNSLKNILEITNKRLNTPSEESNRQSLNESIRKNGSPKLMKNHPGVKLLFEN